MRTMVQIYLALVRMAHPTVMTSLQDKIEPYWLKLLIV